MSVTSTVELVTPERARHLRDTAHFERQRTINQKNVQRLATEILAGRLTDGTQIYLCELPNGELRIANGNHTLEAVYLAGKPQLLTMTTKKVRDLNEIGSIYAVFDTQKGRTWLDSAKAMGIDQEVPNSQKILSAVRIIQSGFQISTGRASVHETLSNVHSYQGEAILFEDLKKGSLSDSARLMARAGILAVILETLRHQPSLASEFWTEVAGDDGLSNDNPAKALLNWLRRNPNASGAGSQRDHVLAAAQAWNTRFKDEERQIIRVSKTNSFFLLGTPHDAGYNPDAKAPGDLFEMYDVPTPEARKGTPPEEVDPKVEIGSFVSVRRLADKRQITIQILGNGEKEDPKNGLILSTSPIAQAMMGLTVNDKFELSVSGKKIEYQILEIC
jgi:hypothetical protein